MDLNEIAAFASVVREGSFTRAAAMLAIPKSTLSERVTRLEQHLGVRLLERTTRSLKPTPAGAAYFERVSQVVAELDAATAAVAESHRAARGLIRIAAPTLFVRMFLLEAIEEFMAKNPEVEVDVVAADRTFHLLEEGLDLAILVVPPLDDVVSTRLASATRLLVASPAYIAKRGAPQVPEDLTSHTCVLSATLATPQRRTTWTFERDGADATTVTVRGRLIVSSVELACQAALRGAGVTMVASLLAQAEVDAGRLVHLLPKWRTGSNELVLVHGPTRDLPARVRMLVDFVMARFEAAAPPHGLVKAATGRRTARRIERDS